MSEIKTAVAVKNGQGKKEEMAVKIQEVLTAANVNAAPEQEQQKTPLSFEERKAAIDKLANLTKQWNRLNESAKDLDGLRLRDDGRSPKITIEDSEGEEWDTTNSRFISKVIQVMHGEMLTRMDEVKEQIEAITI